jgi:hypothetical protein
VLVAIAGQAFWIARVLKELRDDLGDLRADLRAVRGDLGVRLDRIEDTLLRDRSERSARLKERRS